MKFERIIEPLGKHQLGEEELDLYRFKKVAILSDSRTCLNSEISYKKEDGKYYKIKQKSLPRNILYAKAVGESILLKVKWTETPEQKKERMKERIVDAVKTFEGNIGKAKKEAVPRQISTELPF